MSYIGVSVIVTNNSEVLENKLDHVELRFKTEEEYREYFSDLDIWLAQMPIPGQIRKKRENILTGNDTASVHAAKILDIIPPREELLFAGYFHDREAELARIEKRPYDHSQMELV